MKTLLKIILIAAVGLVLAGCQTLSRSNAPSTVAEPAVSLPQNSTINVQYPVKAGWDVKVTFENHRTCDAAQLGLFMIASLEGQAEVPGYDDPLFFPRYFAMINRDIGDGLLFISEKEATAFARATYLEYQRSVMNLDYLEEIPETRILEDIISDENSVTN